MDTKNTLMFNNGLKAEQKTPREIMEEVYDALDERGYNAIDQIVGYLLSGDPSYITSHNNARNVIRQIDRDDLTEELVRYYLNKSNASVSKKIPAKSSITYANTTAALSLSGCRSISTAVTAYRPKRSGLSKKSSRTNCAVLLCRMCRWSFRMSVLRPNWPNRS